MFLTLHRSVFRVVIGLEAIVLKVMFASRFTLLYWTVQDGGL
jgi:hypothetical protein